MRRRLSRCAAASLSCLYRHANACLIAPLSSQRLVVASSPLSPRQCLSCRAVASLVAPPPLSLEHLSLRRHLSLSMRRRLSRFAAASIATPTPVSLHLSRASGWLLHRHLSFARRVFLYQSDVAARDERPHVGRLRAISASCGHGGDVCSWPLVHVSTHLLLE